MYTVLAAAPQIGHRTLEELVRTDMLLFYGIGISELTNHRELIASVYRTTML